MCLLYFLEFRHFSFFFSLRNIIKEIREIRRTQCQPFTSTSNKTANVFWMN